MVRNHASTDEHPLKSVVFCSAAPLVIPVYSYLNIKTLDSVACNGTESKLTDCSYNFDVVSTQNIIYMECNTCKSLQVAKIHNFKGVCRSHLV